MGVRVDQARHDDLVGEGVVKFGGWRFSQGAIDSTVPVDKTRPSMTATALAKGRPASIVMTLRAR